MGPAESGETEQPRERRRLPAIAGFQIVREVGQGGMGVVYEAIELALGRRAALKVLLVHRAPPSAVERFHREARAAAKLHHTNIVPVFGVGEDDGQLYYVMQFIESESLDKIVKRLSRHAADTDCAGSSSPPSRETEPAPNETISASLSTEGSNPVYFRTVARIGRQVAEALAYAHRQGIVHRDIKPANLLLDAQGNAWVTDFGLAKAFEGDDGLTQTGHIVGTLRFMAPERFDGRSEPRSDVYALGVTLYELLTLRPLFAESDRTKLLDRILHEEPVPLRQIDRRIARDLETIVQKAMAKEPEARYASAAAFAEDLRRFLSGETILARRSGLTGRLWRWTRRNPRLAALLLIIGLVLAVGGVGSMVAALRFQRLAHSESRVRARADRMFEAEQIARARADHNAAEAQAVVDFLIRDMLVATRPGNSRGQAITADEVLAQASHAIEGRFVDQPLVKAYIRHEIALAYFALGIGAPAVPHAERARTLRTQHLGAQHPFTIDSTLLVAMCLSNAGAFGAASGLAEQVYKSRLGTLGPDHVETADALFWVACTINKDPSRLEEARSQLVQVVDVYRHNLRPDNPKITVAMGGLAWTLGCSKRYAESLASYDELLLILKSYRGPEDFDVALAMCGMAEVLAWSGRREEAAEAYEQALRIVSREQDPGNSFVYSTMEDLLDLRRAQVAHERAQGRRVDAARLIQTKALPVCNQRVTRAEAWFARDAADAEARLNLVLFLAARGAFLAELGRRDDGLKDVERGLALGGGILFPPEPSSNLAGAERSARAPAKGDPRLATDRGAVSLFKIAEVYALLAESCHDDLPQSSRDADRAIDILRRAVDRGFRRKDLIAKNRGFAFLRSRSDFRAIFDGLPRRIEWAIEGESLSVLRMNGPFDVAPQALPEKRMVGLWSGDAILIGSPRQRGDWVDLALPVPADGTYRVVAYLIAAPGHGVVQVSLDGRPQGTPFDGFRLGPDPRSFAIFDVTPSPVTVELGSAHLRKGTATLRLEVVGKAEGSQGYSWGLDCLVLRPLSPTTIREGDGVRDAFEK